MPDIKLQYVRAAAVLLAIQLGSSSLSVSAQEAQQPEPSFDECVAARCAAILSSVAQVCSADHRDDEVCDVVKEQLRKCQESCEQQ